MTRRITVVVVAVVTIALALAGVGTAVLAGVADRREARDRLEAQADDVAALIGFLGSRAPGAVAAIRRSLQVDGVVIAPFDLSLAERLPAGVEVTAGDVADLRAGVPVSWIDGSTIAAVAAIPRSGTPAVVVVSTDVPLLARGLARWLALASLATLVLATVVGVVLARRLGRPLREIDDAARRIAAGDLSVRVRVPDGDDELAQLARSVNEMSAALARADELERGFLLSISHDLRTPLTSIRGFAEGLADGTMTDADRAAGVILGEARRLERLVADLLELAHLDARRFSLRPLPIDVGEVVETAAEAFRPAFDEAGVALLVSAGEALPARADPDRVGQVVANLVENALKHADRRAAVSAVAAGPVIRIEVTDDGAGIPVDEQQRVFDRLYAGQRASRRPVGSGLGLAIVAELVAAMGGSVSCSSPAAGGTAFVVEIPAGEA